jgi:hypothetical protein
MAGGRARGRGPRRMGVWHLMNLDLDHGRDLSLSVRASSWSAVAQCGVRGRGGTRRTIRDDRSWCRRCVRRPSLKMHIVENARLLGFRYLLLLEYSDADSWYYPRWDALKFLLLLSSIFHVISWHFHMSMIVTLLPVTCTSRTDPRTATLLPRISSCPQDFSLPFIAAEHTAII